MAPFDEDVRESVGIDVKTYDNAQVLSRVRQSNL
jgi:hypothetical protein